MILLPNKALQWLPFLCYNKPIGILCMSSIPLRSFVSAVLSTVFIFSGTAFGECDPEEIKIKFSHVTNADRHPKGIAAGLLESRVNKEMNGKACMEVFPNSTLFDDNKVLEAMLNGDIQLAAPSLSKFENLQKNIVSLIYPLFLMT